MSAPNDPAARIGLAASTAADALAVNLWHFRREHGTDPVLVVAVPDCEIGKHFLAAMLGPRAQRALSGPAVFALSLDEFMAHFGPDDQAPLRARVLELGAQPGDMRIAFMVNGSGIELRRVPGPGAMPGRAPSAHVPN